MITATPTRKMSPRDVVAHRAGSPARSRPGQGRCRDARRRTGWKPQCRTSARRPLAARCPGRPRGRARLRQPRRPRSAGRRYPRAPACQLRSSARLRRDARRPAATSSCRTSGRGSSWRLHTSGRGSPALFEIGQTLPGLPRLALATASQPELQQEQGTDDRRSAGCGHEDAAGVERPLLRDIDLRDVRARQVIDARRDGHGVGREPAAADWLNTPLERRGVTWCD